MQPLFDRKHVHTLSAYVSNKPGVLARVAQSFARRGYNIDSLSVSPTTDGKFSRMTLTVRGDPAGLDQIILQMNKLVDVVHCFEHAEETSVVKELALIKVAVGAESRAGVLQIVEHFNAKTVDFTEKSLIIMVAGDSAKVDAMMALLKSFKIVELVRTGKVVMARGEEVT